MRRKPDKRLIDELPDVDMPASGYGQRELMVIDKLFNADLPDGELINLYFLVHDWAMDDETVFAAKFKQIEDVIIGRMCGCVPEAGEVRSLPGFDPENYREATEAVCSGVLTDWQILELYAIAQANRADAEIGHRWQAIMDLCRSQILRRIKQVRSRLALRREGETLPPAVYRSADIEARQHANEEYGLLIQTWRERLGMYEGGLAEALCLTETDIKQTEEGSPPIDPRMILAPLSLAAAYYPSDEPACHLTSKTYVAHYYEAARRMTPKVREIWLLNKADGLTIGEIAAWQNLNKVTIAARLREAMIDVERFGPQPPNIAKRKRGRRRDADREVFDL